MNVSSGNYVDCYKNDIKITYYTSSASDPKDRLILNNKSYDIISGFQIYIPKNTQYEIKSDDPKSKRIYQLKKIYKIPLVDMTKITEITKNIETKQDKYNNILWYLGAGIIFGIILNIIDLKNKDLFIEITKVVRDVYINLLKSLIIPTIFFQIILAMTNLEINIGYILVRFFGYNFLFILLGGIIALSVVYLIRPGKGVNLQTQNTENNIETLESTFSQIIINIVPDNILKSLVDGKMLSIIFYAILIGYGVKHSKSNAIKDSIIEINNIFKVITNLVIKIGNIGILNLSLKPFQLLNIKNLIDLYKYVLSVISSLFLFNFGALPIVLWIITKKNPLKHLKKSFPQMIYAFSTSSSGATLPISLDVGINKLGIREEIASIIYPLGASLNMSGTTIFQYCATVFIANSYDIDLSYIEIFIIVASTIERILTAVAEVPGMGLIVLAIILQKKGLPVEGIALIIGLDRILDMLRTSVNVYGDSIIASIIDHQLFKSQKKKLL